MLSKRRLAIAGILMLSVLLFSIPTVFAYSTIQIRVYGRTYMGNYRLVNWATVVLRGEDGRTYRASGQGDGWYIARVPSGTYDIEVSYPGYKPYTYQDFHVALGTAQCMIYLEQRAERNYYPYSYQDRGIQQRKEQLINYVKSGLAVIEPKTMYPHISYSVGEIWYTTNDQWNATKDFVDSFITKSFIESEWFRCPYSKWFDDERVLMWTEGNTVYFGVLVTFKNIVELQYITVRLE